MGYFVGKLDVEKENGTWRLLKSITYVTSSGYRIEVPEGFETDFASVPRLPLAYVLAGNTAHQAAVIHDYLYHTQKVPRALADEIFLEAMHASGEPWFRRHIMYGAVRVGGWVAWNKNAKENGQSS